MIGKVVDGFRVLEQIGAGACGEVYLCSQEKLNRNVALKVFEIHKDKLQEEIEIFLNEAKQAASIQHPNIVNIYNVGQYGNLYYIAMEYVEGITLDYQISKKILPEKNLLDIASQLCEGLQAMLTKHIIHRDIKPENIILTPGNLIKITDFGLAGNIEIINKKLFTGGTPYYMSPEQSCGEKIDFRSDIYSLGSTLYHLLTGHPIFTGKTIEELAFKHQLHPIVSPRKHVNYISDGMCAILAKMLRKKPKERYKSYGDIISDIELLKKNNNPVYASEEDTKITFIEGANKNQVRKTFSILSFFSTKTDITKVNHVSNVIIVSRLGQVDRLNPHSFIHFVASISELSIHLESQPAFVILDSNYLNVRIVDFIKTLSGTHGKSKVIILSDIDSPKENLFVPYSDYEHLLANLPEKKLEETKYYSAESIDLGIILDLAKFNNWTTSLIVKTKDEQGLVKLSRGKITRCEHSKEKNNVLEYLISNNTSWQIETNEQQVSKILENSTDNIIIDVSEPDNTGEDLFDLLAKKAESSITQRTESTITHRFGGETKTSEQLEKETVSQQQIADIRTDEQTLSDNKQVIDNKQRKILESDFEEKVLENNFKEKKISGSQDNVDDLFDFLMQKAEKQAEKQVDQKKSHMPK